MAKITTQLHPDTIKLYGRPALLIPAIFRPENYLHVGIWHEDDPDADKIRVADPSGVIGTIEYIRDGGQVTAIFEDAQDRDINRLTNVTRRRLTYVA